MVTKKQIKKSKGKKKSKSSPKTKRPVAKAKKKTSAKKTTVKKAKKRKAAAPRRPAKNLPSRKNIAPGLSFGTLNYRALETEISRLTDMLQALSKKSILVRKSLNYLEREQKRLNQQIQEAKKYLSQLKNWGLQALREFPDNAEDIFSQLKSEFNRIYSRLGLKRK